MKKTLLLIPVFLVAGTLSAADEASPLSLKLRAQTGLTAEEGMRNGFGAGLNYAFKMGPGALNVELGYQFFSGKQYRQPIGANNLGLAETNPDPVAHPDWVYPNAVDSRKNSAEGLSLRLGWSQELFKDLAIQGGVALASLKNHHESIGTFGLNQDTGAAGGYGAWTMAIDKSWVSASPFVGIKWDLDEIGAIEVNVLFANYKVTTVTPVYGSTSVTPSIGEKSITKPKIEFGYSFKF